MQLYAHQENGLERTKDQIDGLKETDGMRHVPVKGYEGLYEVDSDGNVYSVVQNSHRRKGILKQYSNGTGYWKVNLYDRNGVCKHKYVHRLVAEAFIPNPLNLKEVNHKDLNKANCKASNLEWCSRRQNLEHAWKNGMKRTCETHGSSKLNWEAVNDIRTKALSQKEYAKKYHVAQCTISAIQLHRLWKEGDANAVVSTSD